MSVEPGSRSGTSCTDRFCSHGGPGCPLFRAFQATVGARCEVAALQERAAEAAKAEAARAAEAEAAAAAAEREAHTAKPWPWRIELARSFRDLRASELVFPEQF